MFKVGDQFRRYRNGGDYTKIYKVTRVAPNKVWDDRGAWHYLSNIIRAYPDTPAGRKQEQLDLIAEKESIIGECNEAIKAARKLIAEIDNRPIDVGDHVIPKGLKPSPVNAYYLVVGKHIYRCGTTLVTQCMLAPNDPANARDIPISSRIDSWEHDPRV